MNKLLKRILGVGAGILVLNLTANGLFGISYINGKYGELRNSKNLAYSKLDNATDKLSFLGSLKCTKDKYLQEKSKLEKEIERYTLEVEQKGELLNDLDKKSEKTAERALVYGYFKN